jgi:putative chitinase
MVNRSFFFYQVRASLFGGVLKQSQVNAMTAILDEWENNWARKDDRWLAYMLATAHHETDRTMRPIEEYGKGAGRRYGQNLKLDGTRFTDTTERFFGRGLVQLTWYENYHKAGKKLGQDFIQNPALVLQPDNATEIMFHGMNEGWFTGKKLSLYFNPTTEDWINARRIINGLDKANLIAGYGKHYYAGISHTT